MTALLQVKVKTADKKMAERQFFLKIHKSFEVSRNGRLA